MGKKWFKKKKNVKDPDGKRPQKLKRERPQTGYEDIKRENKEFDQYYKTQGIVPSEEWESFMEYMTQDLPVAFRFTGFKAHVQTLSKIMQQNFFTNLITESGKVLEPMSLPWYPDKLGWQLNATRKDIRRSEAFWKLHQFLINETETGNISRQEAVSMIPPVLLDVKPHHKVLDLCAAPGSKTAQIIEFLHCDTGLAIPEGIVVANDADNKRCYMLTHQAKRLQSPTLMITNHDAALLPNIHHTRQDGTVGPMKFDRILCDVPCSGDGTLRKNFDVWAKWNAVNGANLHGLQFRIARRGLELLSVGGRLVYSTCSLNPLENEAVVNRLFTEFGESVALVDAKQKLPGLKIVEGLEEWVVMTRDLEVVPNVESIPPKSSNYVHRNLFPPNAEEREKRQLRKCIRILPHHQNTGGFFVAVIEKLKPLPGEKVYESSLESSNDVTTREESKRFKGPPKKRRCRGYKEEPYFYLSEENEEWKKLQDFYGLRSEADAALFLTRVPGAPGKNLYFTNALVKDIVVNNENRIKIINTGVKVLVRCENKGSICKFRLAQEGSSVLLPFLTKRKLKVAKEDMVTLLLNEDSEIPPQIDDLHENTKSQCDNLDCGSIVFEYEDLSDKDLPLIIHLVGWKGKNSLRCYVAKNERIHFLRLLGCDISAFEKNKFEELRNNQNNDAEDLGTDQNEDPKDSSEESKQNPNNVKVLEDNKNKEELMDGIKELENTGDDELKNNHTSIGDDT